MEMLIFIWIMMLGRKVYQLILFALAQLFRYCREKKGLPTEWDLQR